MRLNNAVGDVQLWMSELPPRRGRSLLDEAMEKLIALVCRFGGAIAF